MTESRTVQNPLRDPRTTLRRVAIAALAMLILMAMLTDIVIDRTSWDRIGTIPEILRTASYFVPDLAFFPQIVMPLLETVLMAFWGTVLGVLAAIPVAYLAARNVTPHAWISYPLGRGLTVLSRSTHEVIFALIYVSALGLGPLPGILALASRSVGFIAKTTAEAIENVERAPIEAIEATGAGRLNVLIYGVVPQVFPVFLGNVIFQFDINIRRASILGLVGAGGIGFLFAEVVQRVQYEKAGTIVLGIIAVVVVGEFLSNRIRNRLL